MIRLIVAMANNGAIGKDNKIPWKLSADLKRFKALTMGHTLIMGRKTFESIGRALPGRTTIVLSKKGFAAPEGVIVSRTYAAALEVVWTPDIFICGGAEIYADVLGYGSTGIRVDQLDITRIDADFEGDTYFPFVSPDDRIWIKIESVGYAGSTETPFAYSFETWRRK